eukprot:747185-Lingulodinium_polyedra.AAC.1
MAIRFPRILKSMADAPAELGNLVSCFEKATTPLAMIRALGLEGHPLIQEACAEPDRDAKFARLRKNLSHAIYLTSAK